MKYLPKTSPQTDQSLWAFKDLNNDWTGSKLHSHQSCYPTKTRHGIIYGTVSAWPDMGTIVKNPPGNGIFQQEWHFLTEVENTCKVLFVSDFLTILVLALDQIKACKISSLLFKQNIPHIHWVQTTVSYFMHVFRSCQWNVLCLF